MPSPIRRVAFVACLLASFVAMAAPASAEGEWVVDNMDAPEPPTGLELADVTCVVTTNCIAVGSDTSSGNVPIRGGSVGDWMPINFYFEKSVAGRGVAVDCTGNSSRCMLLGKGESGAFAIPMALNEIFGISMWTAYGTTIPSPEGARQVTLEDVDCSSPFDVSSCVAVGSYVDATGTLRALALHWNGTAWSLAQVPDGEGDAKGILTGVSCPTTSTCMAVGHYWEGGAGGGFRPLTARFNEGAWTLLETPEPSGASTNLLQGVDCASAGECVAVGYYQPTEGKPMALALAWDGEWSLADPAAPGGADAGKATYLTGVSCPESDTCVAAGRVGTSSASSEEKTMIQAWDGEGWAIQSSPSPQKYSRLESVDCSSSAYCVAVGSQRPGHQQKDKEMLGLRYE